MAIFRKSACFGGDFFTDTYPDSLEGREGYRAAWGSGWMLSLRHASPSSARLGALVAVLRGALRPSLLLSYESK